MNWVTGTEVTKRNVLSFVAQVYDVIGMLTPITVREKTLMQNLTKMKYQ